MDPYRLAVKDLFSRRPNKGCSTREIGKILALWDNPQNAFPSIHVAGTNGKGSVSAKIAHTLHRSGLKTALYTSPHLIEYTERIRVNGEMIPKDKILSYYRELADLIEERGWNPNFFDCTTAMAFRFFKEKQVDIAVIETGLGGKNDATNIVTPILSIITTVEMDHMDYLGTTLELIAREKAGIIKEGVPVVLGPKANHPEVLNRAKALGVPIFSVSIASPNYSIENSAIAKKSLEILNTHFFLDEKDVDAGLSYELPCRFEKRGDTIFDVAHNPGGFASLVKRLQKEYPLRKFRFLLEMGVSKNWEECLKQIVPIAQHIHLAASENPYSAPPEKLAVTLEKIGNIPFTVETSSYEGIMRAKAALKNEELLVVCGSFYLIGEIYHDHACRA